jgi:Flp pilus assembly pilin Flp
MVRIWAFALSRFPDERGAQLVEYALILIAISIVALAGALLLGPTTDAKFDDVDACFNVHANC